MRLGLHQTCRSIGHQDTIAGVAGEHADVNSLCYPKSLLPVRDSTFIDFLENVQVSSSAADGGGRLHSTLEFVHIQTTLLSHVPFDLYTNQLATCIEIRCNWSPGILSDRPGYRQSWIDTFPTIRPW